MHSKLLERYKYLYSNFTLGGEDQKFFDNEMYKKFNENLWHKYGI